MKKLRLSMFLALAGAVLAGTILFQVSQEVQTAESEMNRLREAVASERETIRVLNAEWAYLNRPERLESLAAEYLNMAPPRVQQMETSADILPPAPEAEADVEGMPVAFDQDAPALTEKSVPVPAVKPRRAQDENKNFQTLLDRLTPAAGGAP